MDKKDFILEQISDLAKCTDTLTRRITKQQGQIREMDKKLDQLLAKKKPKPRAAKKFEYDEGFNDIWAIYPKRAGSNPKYKAYQVLLKRIDEGDAWHKIYDGVEQYAKFCDATGKTGTEYVLQLTTFLGPNRFYENDWTIPDSARKSAIPRDDNEMVAWAKEQGCRDPRPGETYNAYRAYVESEA